MANATKVASGNETMMRDVHQGLLFVADAPSARDVKLLYKHNVQAVVDVAANESPAQLPREFIYCRIPLLDGDGNSPLALKLAVETIVALVRSQTPTVVACSAGMSRSPAIAAAAISLLSAQAPDDCLLQIVHNGPHDVSPRLWAQIKMAALLPSFH
jgi:predicted protein tyrosine phosphatase